MRKEGFSAAILQNLLLAQTGDSGVWPDNATFRESWLHKPLYGPLSSPKLIHLYARLNQTFMSSKSEAVTFSEQPTVEHIMPQSWQDNWPLPNGSKGMDFMELLGASESDPRAVASRKRDIYVQTLGNMTILSHGLNAAQSNLGWKQKRPEMIKHSLLPINQTLLQNNSWDEEKILKRGEELFERAQQIWEK